MRVAFALGLSSALLGCDAYSAPRSLLRSRAALVTVPHVTMAEDSTPELKIGSTLAGDENAPVYEAEEANYEVKSGEEVKQVTPIELRPIEELTDEERRTRAKILAVKKYAPWMSDITSPEAIAAREEADRQRKSKKSEKLVGNRIDPAKQEVAGAGLKLQLTMTDEGADVSLAWFTGSEEDNAGFNVMRKGRGDDDFKVIASFDKFQSLRSKGPGGGAYRFVDENVAPGPYLYKVQDVSASSNFVTDVAQKGVEIETKEEASTNFAIVAGFLGVLGAITAVGIALDPQ